MEKEIVIQDAKTLTQADFIKKYPHHFLIGYESNVENKEATKMAFSTISVKSLDQLLKSTAGETSKQIKELQFVLKSNKNPFASKIIVGRTSTQDIVVDDTSISKFHGYFEIKNENIFYIDRGSTNGTFINGNKLNPSENYELKDKDIISFASIKYTFFSNVSAYSTLKYSS